MKEDRSRSYTGAVQREQEKKRGKCARVGKTSVDVDEVQLEVSAGRIMKCEVKAIACCSVRAEDNSQVLERLLHLYVLLLNSCSVRFAVSVACLQFTKDLRLKWLYFADGSDGDEPRARSTSTAVDDDAAAAAVGDARGDRSSSTFS